MRKTWGWLVALTCSLVLIACGGEESEKKDAGATDVATDAGNDASAADTADTGAGDTSGDTGEVCAGLPKCVDDNGIENLGLCPAPQSDYACQDGCCVVKKVCKSDAECADQLGTPLCPDERFTCGCDLATGACIQTVCTGDADCASGTICDGGGCRKAPAASDLSAVLLRPMWIARPGESGEAAILLGAQARDTKGHVDPAATFEWKLEGQGFSVDAGKLTAGAEAGKATIVATVTGGKASQPAKLWNLGKVPDGIAMRITLVDEESHAPLTGKVHVVCGPKDATPTTLEVELTDGQASFEKLTPPCDLHAAPVDHDAVSVLGLDLQKAGVDLLLSARLRHFAALAYDIDGKPIADDTKLVHGDVVSGEVSYTGQGEAALGITSFGVGSDLLLFNLDAIIGPNVSRPFHPDAPSLVNPNPGEPQDIPGGVTFYLGKKVVDSYALSGPPGRRVLWSLSGKLPLSELLSQVSAIVGAVQDGLDVGKVVGVLLPYLQGFYSQVVVDVELADKEGVQTPKSLDLAPDVPLGVFSEITPPALPSAGEGQWADLMLAIGGAMLPDGTMVPLGLAAGSDTANAEDKADGKVDGDQETPGDQPLELNTAPLHGGLRVGTDNRVLVTAAINVGGGGKREGGSIVFSKVGALADEIKPDAFLPYALASTWQAEGRMLTVAKVEGAAFYRVVMTGAEGRRWTVLLPASMTDTPIALPDATAFGLDADLVNKPKRVFVGAFDLWAADMSLWSALADGTMLDLVRKTRRSSFIDVH